MPAADTRASTRRQRIILAMLLLLGAGLRLYNLGHRSLSTDEANLFWMARGTTGEIIRHNAAGNSAPPLYALALNPFAEAHASEAVLRSLSYAAGVAALAVLYVLARDHSGPLGALFAVFVAAVSPSQVFYSQFLREYSLAFLCATLLLLAFTRFQRHATWPTWMALTVLGVLSLFVQYGLALLVLALNLVFVIELRHADQRARRIVLWALAQAAVLAAAWVVYDQTLRHQLRPGGFGASYLGQGYWDGTLPSLLRLTVGNTFELFAFAHPAVPILQILVVLGIVRFWRTPQGRQAILLLVTPLAVTLGAACLRLYPYLGARHSMMLTVMLYVCAASGFVLLRSLDWKSAGTTIVIAWLAAEGLYGTYRTLMSTEPQHMRPVIALLAERVRPGDRIYLYHFAVTPFRYYYPAGRSEWIGGVQSPADPAAHDRQIADVLARPGRVWMLFSLCQASECDVIRRAAAALRPIKRVGGDTGTQLYLAEPASAAP